MTSKITSIINSSTNTMTPILNRMSTMGIAIHPVGNGNMLIPTDVGWPGLPSLFMIAVDNDHVLITLDDDTSRLSLFEQVINGELDTQKPIIMTIDRLDRLCKKCENAPFFIAVLCDQYVEEGEDAFITFNGLLKLIEQLILCNDFEKIFKTLNEISKEEFLRLYKSDDKLWEFQKFFPQMNDMDDMDEIS